ncbi:N-acetylmuramoyl-L-alanine amidase [Porphyromonas crevioricanis]|uniref:N-acetylmuramoyl-L-alanine amidase n=1 Tax=Porphyromonas crevioricanis TaxID=393921 RepID=A0A2X4SSM2_9PORP|nr:N-acetylmuramoyl-L-alanine amidase [Porphyromonas crevioricanis]GAD06571.1 N-acetylmuramoyl-L-alanine amidase [Porphyromonas crevioricanis JCM 13913]SQH72801.1 N-acetylmuramoyl-L-alanine amidase [Porphyromonas crevioricanis]
MSKRNFSLSEVEYIVIHCSATRENRSYSVEDLLRDHVGRGFVGIGYHYYVTRDGHIHLTRPLDKMGAHVLGYNHCSIGICYEGGLDEHGKPADTRTPEQRVSLLRLIRIVRQYCPLAIVLGHRDLTVDRNGDGRIRPDEWMKNCPCFDARQAYSRI